MKERCTGQGLLHGVFFRITLDQQIHLPSRTMEIVRQFRRALARRREIAERVADDDCKPLMGSRTRRGHCEVKAVDDRLRGDQDVAVEGKSVEFNSLQRTRREHPDLLALPDRLRERREKEIRQLGGGTIEVETLAELEPAHQNLSPAIREANPFMTVQSVVREEHLA